MEEAIFSPSLQTMRVNARCVRLGVLSSGSGSNFEAIVDAIGARLLNAELATVVCNNPRAGTIERAGRLGVNCRVVDHRVFESRAAFDEAVVSQLTDAGVDWVAMAGWMRIATPVLIEAFEGRMVNLHPSLLPSYPGFDAIGQALRGGAKLSGCSVHGVTLDVDAGPIIAQAATPVFSDDTVETLALRIHRLEHALYPRAIAHAIDLGG